MTIGYERLAEYIVGINLKAGKVNRQRFAGAGQACAEQSPDATRQRCV